MKMQPVLVLLFMCFAKPLMSDTSSMINTSSANTSSMVNTSSMNTSQKIDPPSEIKGTPTSNQTTCTKGYVDLKTILTFVTGLTTSAIIFSTVLFFVAVCKRCEKQQNESSGLEFVQSFHDDMMMQTDEKYCGTNENTPLQSHPDTEVTKAEPVAELTEEKEIISGENTVGDPKGMNELQYASIDFAVLQKRNQNVMPQSQESDYAEIQLKKVDEEEENKTLGKVDHDGVDQGRLDLNCVDQGEMDECVLKQDEPGQNEVILDDRDDNRLDQDGVVLDDVDHNRLHWDGVVSDSVDNTRLGQGELRISEVCADLVFQNGMSVDGVDKTGIETF